MARLLVVDDDPHILELVILFLTQAGHEVVTAASGHAALEAAAGSRFDLVVLDVLLPGVDGREVCRRLRRQGTVPVLMLTALGEIHHKLQGFDAGADDYLAKPFEPVELVARVRALLKRSAPAGTVGPGGPGGSSGPGGPVTVGRLVLDPASMTVTAGGERHDVPAKEFELLAWLARAPGRLFSRDQILAAVWGEDFAGTDRTVDVYVNRLRTRFPEAEFGYRITPVRGVGYRLEVGP